MRRLLSTSLRTAALVAAVLVSSHASFAAPLSDRVPTLVTALQARAALVAGSHLTKPQKREKAAIAKALAGLAADTGDLAKMLANAAKVIGAVDTAYPGDASLDPVLDKIIDDVDGSGLLFAVTLRGGTLFSSIETIAPGATRTKAQSQSDLAETNIVASQSATSRTARLKLLAAALKAIVKGEKIVKKAGGTTGGGVTSSVLDADVDTTAQHLHVPAASGPSAYSVTYDSAANLLTIVASAMVSGTFRALTVAVPTPGTGSHGVSTVSHFNYNPIGMPPVTLAATSGTVDFTTWDPGHRKVAGTFDVTYSNGSVTVHLVHGTFSSVAVQVQ